MFGAYRAYTIREPFPFTVMPLLVELHFKCSTVGSTEAGAPEIIDLSSPSWEADAMAFMDSSEREVERDPVIRRERNETSGVAAGVDAVRTKSKSSRHDNTSFAKGDIGKKGSGRKMDRPSASLTSISALFGGGGAKGSRYMNANNSISTGFPICRPGVDVKFYTPVTRFLFFLVMFWTRGPDPTFTETQNPI